MSEHQRETAFLRQCLRFDESPERRELEQGIVQIQRDSHCVHRAAWLMALVASVATAGLIYEVVLDDNFPYNTPHFIINTLVALGLGSLVCLLALIGLAMIYRQKLDQCREGCRRIITRLLESRLDQSLTPPLPAAPDANVGDPKGRTVRAAHEGNGSSASVESAARG